MEKGKPRMITTKEAAILYGMAIGTLQNFRSLKKGPRYYTVGRKVLYRVDDLEFFFTSRPVLTMDSLPEAVRQ